jgi:hypothetical protein
MYVRLGPAALYYTTRIRPCRIVFVILGLRILHSFGRVPVDHCPPDEGARPPGLREGDAGSLPDLESKALLLLEVFYRSNPAPQLQIQPEGI